MGGRIEKEAKARQMMADKLNELPEIFSAFYDWMDARDKSYTTMNNYINQSHTNPNTTSHTSMPPVIQQQQAANSKPSFDM